MSSANIAKGAYHFYTTSSNGITQAQHYFNTVKEISKGDLPPVLDLEQDGLMDKITIEEVNNEEIN